MSSSYLALPDFDLLRVSGEDAAKFLQGQVTCNVLTLQETQWVPGAYCELNGRVIADFRLMTHENCYYLLCEKGVGSILKDALSKYIVFSKATLALVSDEYYRLGFWSEADTAALLKSLASQEQQFDLNQRFISVDGILVATLGKNDTRFEVLIPKDKLDTALENTNFDQAQQERWALCDIQDGYFHIRPESVERYTPQVLNYDLAGAIDFKKGCYRGQEIVARMHYKGSAKKRLFRLQFEGDKAPLYATMEVDGKTLGEIISVAASGEGKFEALAVMTSIALDIPVSTIIVKNTDGTILSSISVVALFSAH